LQSSSSASVSGIGAVVSIGDGLMACGQSEIMRTFAKMVERIAPTNLPILLLGECGTGKTFIAHKIHQLSSRCDQPFLRAVCSELTEDAVAAQFGNQKMNISASAGTLFLKEVSELSVATQRSLLYAIPEGDDSRGSAESPRLISSNTVDLEQEVNAGCFRRELYYRLKGACLHLPALRERKEDVPALAELLLVKHSTSQGMPRPKLSSEDFSLLQEWHWPGNIRELENVIKQIVILNDPKSVLLDLVAVSKEQRKQPPPENGAGTRGSALKAATRAASRRVEEQLILDALAKTRWNRKRAAQDLQISYKSLLSKLKQIGGDKARKV
jgi:DNA-binding NtrC family response regulator